MTDTKPGTADLLRMLTPQAPRLRLVLDTDTYNEVDDQFAIAHLMLASDRFDLEAICAAPFHNERSSGPAEGMELSYNEIIAVLDAIGMERRPAVLRGSTAWMGAAKQPVPSAAAEDIVARARSATPEAPLHVVAIGAVTNVSSALLMAPDILDRIVVTWIAGHVLDWPSCADFNLKQDIGAAQVLFDSGCALALVPAMGVSSHMLCTVPEIERFVAPHGAIGALLAQRFASYRPGILWSKEIWDLAAAAWLFDAAWVRSELIPRPIVTDNGTWSFDRRRPPMRYVSMVNRDRIMIDFYNRLQAFAPA